MISEDRYTDCKSLRIVTGKTADWNELAKDCVCFANGSGGRLLLGVEDGESGPPADQRVPKDLPERIRKRIGELTVNVQALPVIERSPKGGEYIVLSIDRSASVASTTDGRYFLRVADSCVPVTGDDVLRLAKERPGRPWESMGTDVSRGELDPRKIDAFVGAIRASDRVKGSVREKSPDELLVHYGLVQGGVATRLGVLLLGNAASRRALGFAPIVQAIKYDDRKRKINKWVWDDHELSPVELVDAIWNEVPDFRESYEVAEGLYPGWLGRLVDFGLVQSTGRTKGTRYFVPPDLLKTAGLAGRTSLKRIEAHRLDELIQEDLRRYPDSRIGEIHDRIGAEIPRSHLRRRMQLLVESGVVTMSGVRAGSRYRLEACK